MKAVSRTTCPHRSNEDTHLIVGPNTPTLSPNPGLASHPFLIHPVPLCQSCSRRPGMDDRISLSRFRARI